MKLLVIGHKGMLGTDLTAAAKSAGHTVTGFDFPEIDISKRESIERILSSVNCEAVINCAAYTAVDACETHQEAAFAVNAAGAGNLAAWADRAGYRFVHYSTDYVFDGNKKDPYLESDLVNPASVYGKSKLEGELLVQKSCRRSFIFRIAWLYGIAGNNFVKTIRTLAKKNAITATPLRVVNDQWGTPTWTVSVCRQTLRMIATDYFGLYHATSEGKCSWYDFAKTIVAKSGLETPVNPCSTAEFTRPAPRPANSVLENGRLKKLGMNCMPPWEEAFEEFLREEKTANLGAT